jgi:predicted transcriptional regulator
LDFRGTLRIAWLKEGVVAEVVQVLPNLNFLQIVVVLLKIEFGKVSQGQVVCGSHVETMEDIANERVRLLICNERPRRAGD